MMRSENLEKKQIDIKPRKKEEQYKNKRDYEKKLKKQKLVMWAWEKYRYIKITKIEENQMGTTLESIHGQTWL